MKDKASLKRRPKDYGRRDFLRMSAWLGVGSAVLPTTSHTLPDAGVRPKQSPVRRVRLGRTGVEISDLGFGTFALRDSDSDVALVRYALARGITHFDTAEGYQDGESEKALGRALQGVRNQVTLTTKVWADENDREKDLIARLDGSLQRLRTDRVDFLLNHAVNSPERMSNPEWQGFVARAKQAGKIRYSGMSGHGPNLVPCLKSAFAEGQLDVILVAYNYIQSPDFLDSARVWIQQQLGAVDWVALQPDLVQFLAQAHEAGVGVMAMKTLRGARHNDMRPFEKTGGTFAQAALRWVLSDTRVDSAMITMKSRDAVDEYIAASGGKSPSGEDVAFLARYEALNRGTQCIQGCGACLDHCPEGVPISDVLRVGMYERDYGERQIATRAYAELGRPGSECMTCSGAPCAEACPTGLPIRSEIVSASKRLG